MPLCPDCPARQTFNAMAEEGYKHLARPQHPMFEGTSLDKNILGMSMIEEGFQTISQLDSLTANFDYSTQCSGVEDNRCPQERAVHRLMERYWEEKRNNS